MPGKRITDHQVHKYKQHRNKLSQVTSVAKAGISERSARRIEDAQSLPSQRPQRNWRTREDPLSAVWDSEVIPLLQTDARLNAVTLLEERGCGGILGLVYAVKPRLARYSRGLREPREADTARRGAEAAQARVTELNQELLGTRELLHFAETRISRQNWLRPATF